jgi:ribonucleotide reductase alpha subunit
MINQFTNELSREIYEQTYKYGNETLETTQKRIAEDIASIEKDKEHWSKEFMSILEDFKFVPGGRIISNAGTNIKGTTYINCFVSGFQGENQDSMDGIMSELKRQAMILKSEGGYGFCCDVMRPRGGFISGIANESPGGVKMLDMWNTQSDVITAGSGKKSERKEVKQKIRKGAQMVTMSCWNPSIEEFITAKQTSGRLDKFNMSVLITDAFMDAVINKKPWDLIFPDFDSNKEIYNKEWDGDINKWIKNGHPIKIWKTYKDANELWDVIMKSTYNRNEPGVLFVDTMNRLNNLAYCEYISATNPSLRKGTKVLTKDGIIDIDILENEKFQVKTLEGKWANAECFLSGKDKKLYKVTLSNKKEIFATKEHKWPVELKGGGWGKVTTDKLSKGNILPFPKNENIGLDIDQKRLTKDYGFMLGWLYGDGWIHDTNRTVYGFLFSKEEKYLSDGILKSINSLKTEKSNLRDCEDGTFEFSTQSNEIQASFKGIYGVKSKEELPSVIWKSNDDFIKGFIDGIFSADGSVSKTNRIILTNKNENFLLSISSLLSFYGIKSYVLKGKPRKSKFPNKKEYNKEYVRYDLIMDYYNADCFAKIFKLSHLEKQSKIEKLINRRKTRKPNLLERIQILSVEETDIHEDVWDIHVYDDTHTFYISDCVTGNCGEQILPIGGVCLLGNLNLTQFIREDLTGWDYDKLKKVIPVAIRFMDNVNDLTYVPLEEQKENLISKRRIGLGILGFGSALLIMKKRYGSPEALELTEKLMNFIANKAYQSSALLAKEKGSFLKLDIDKYLESNYLKNLSDETRNMIKEFGIRNSHLLSVQPTGNSSILANVASGGLEPVFLFEYIRTVIQSYPPIGLDMPINIDWGGLSFGLKGERKTGMSFMESVQTPPQEWKWVKEGDENMLRTVFEGNVYKYDRGRGLLKESVVKDYGVRVLEDMGQWDPKAEWAANINNLKIDEHINTMKVISKYIDSSMSKTINLPSEYKFEDFKNVYMDLYKSGTIKGGTTYRAGTMATVIKKKEEDDTISTTIMKENNVPKRPKVLECDVVRFTNKGEKWIGFIGLLENMPYEIFTGLAESFVIPTWIEKGQIRKEKVKNKEGILISRYDFVYVDKEGYEVIMTGLNRSFSQQYWNIGKMTSALLRHHIHLPSVIEIIDNLNLDGDTMGTWKKGMTRMLKRYVKDDKIATSDTCPNCGSSNLVYKEGCVNCLDCGWSKCT